MRESTSNRAQALAAFLVTAFSAGGCAVVSHNPYLPESGYRIESAALSTDEPAPYRVLESQPGVVVAESDRPDYRRLEAEFAPIPTEVGKAIQIRADFHQSIHPGTRRLAIVLPIWGSAGFPQRKMVKTLLESSAGGVHVVEVHGAEAMIHWQALAVAQSEREFIALAVDSARRVEDTIAGIRQLVGWLDRHGDYEIDVVGFSMGALIGSMVVGSDVRVDGGVFMMGGANPAEILATCNSRKVQRVRLNAMRRFGWTADQYALLMSNLFSGGDARAYAGHYDPEKVLIVDGVLDGCMSRESRHSLWQSTGYPERYRLLATHRLGFMALTPLSLNSAGKLIYQFVSQHPGDDPLLPTSVLTAGLR